MLVSKLLSNDEPGADIRLSQLAEENIIHKLEKLNKEDQEEEIKTNLISALKLISLIDSKNIKSELSKSI